MVLDLLGIVAAFIAIILLLSLAVTSLVEITQSVFQLRKWILRRGVRAMLKKALTAAEFANYEIEVKRYRELIPRTKIEISYLPTIVEIARGAPDPALVNRLKQLFPLMEDRTSEIFKDALKAITLIMSFLVAFVMQVSTPHILHRLITDTAFRSAALSIAESLHGERSTWIENPRDFSEISATALEELANRHPEAKHVIEQASGAGNDIDFLIAELEMLLQEHDVENRACIIEEYRSMLASRSSHWLDDSLAQLVRSEKGLATLNITPWHTGWKFYANPYHWIGICISALLLSLGAPFWFDALGRVIGLLKPGYDSRPKPNPSKPKSRPEPNSQGDQG